MNATHAGRFPLAKLAAVYLVSVPVAVALTPHGAPWEMVTAGCAVALGWMMGLAPWWLAINAIFLPGLAWSLTLDTSPLWPLAALIALVLVYGRIWKSRVPLFFSSARACEALVRLLPAGSRRFLDVGCGDARVLAHLAAVRPDCTFEGVEQAFFPWLLARVRCGLAKAPCAVRRADLWRADFGAYHVVYAYLSPAVMRELWEKAASEMRPGALLVSAFAVPGVRPDGMIDADDAMGTRLHVWRMKGKRGE
jgi:SAM-dependent methyltransferase